MSISTTAERVVELENVLLAAVEPVALAEADRDRAAERLAALVAERESIRRRRATGDKRADDGGRLELLTLDSAELVAARDEAEGRAAAARAAHAAAMAGLTSARRDLADADTRAEIEALDVHAIRLAGLLAATLDQRRVAAGRLGGHSDIAAAQTALRPAADGIGAVLLGVIGDLDALGRRYGSTRPVWVPAERLAFEVRRLELQAANVRAFGGR